MQLPYWDGEIDIETGAHEECAMLLSSAVRMAGMCSPLVQSLSSCLMSFESELLYLNGLKNGICGSAAGILSGLSGQEVFSVSPFLLIMGYSPSLGGLAAAFTTERPDVGCGIARCTFHSGSRQTMCYKTVTVMSDSPLFDDTSFLEAFDAFLRDNVHMGSRLIPYYARAFGYLRAPLPYETDIPRQVIAAEKMSSFLLEETRRAVGSPVLLSMPSPGAPAGMPVFRQAFSSENL